MPGIEILTGKRLVVEYVDVVRRAADENRNAFGFLRAPVYDDFARSGQLFVAVEGKQYAGHVAFGGTYPHIKIRQLNVAPNFRRRGVGRLLLDTLKLYASQHDFLTLRADVAADLEANAFWERSGLSIIHTRPGGSSRGRTINVRELYLGQSDLLTPLRDTSAGEGIGFVRMRASANLSSYALDTNVLLDALRRSGEVHDNALQVLRAALSRQIDIFVTHEMHSEVARNTSNLRADPLLTLVSALPSLPTISAPREEYWIATLGPIVFPDFYGARPLRVQEISDLSHLGAAIEMRMSGFVTRDSALISARHQLLKLFAIDIVTPADLVDELDVDLNSSSFIPAVRDRGSRLEIRVVRFDQLVRFGAEIENISPQAYADLRSCSSASPMTFLEARRDGRTCAIAWGTRLGAHENIVWNIVFFDVSADAWLVADHFLAHLLAQANLRPTAVLLNLYGGDETTIDHMKSRGCLGHKEVSAGSLKLIKLVVGGFVEAEQWSKLKLWIKSAVGLDILSSIEAINSTSENAECRSESGERRAVRWFDLETITGPVLYLFRSGGGVLIPIKRGFAEELLGARQATALQVQSARIRTERVYFRRAAKLDVNAGQPIIFRETAKQHGSGSAIGCARLTLNEILDIDVAKQKYRRQGVMDLDRYETGDTAKKVGVIGFDNFQEFLRPVSFQKLKELGAVSGAQNITAECVPGEVVRNVIRLGFGRG